MMIWIFTAVLLIVILTAVTLMTVNYRKGYQTAEEWHSDGMDLETIEDTASYWTDYRYGSLSYRLGFQNYIEFAKKILKA